MLCGLQCDLRSETSSDDVVSTEEANSMSAEIGAMRFIEVSSKTAVNVTECFEEAVRCSTERRADREAAANRAAAARRGRGRGSSCCDIVGGLCLYILCCGLCRGRCRRPKCDCSLEEAVNATFQCLAFLVATSIYIAIDVGALIVALSAVNTKRACWDELDALWLDPAAFLEVGALSSLIGLGLGMCFKTLCGVDEQAQDGPRLCLLLFFMVWAITGCVLSADIAAIAECRHQGIGKMTVAWSVVKMVESCCGSMDIVINAIMFMRRR